MLILAILSLLARINMSFEQILVFVEKEAGVEPILGRYLKGIEQKIIVIKVSRENEEESFDQVCQSAAVGLTLVLDVTWTGWPKGQALAHDTGVPYLQLETPLKVILRATVDFLRDVRAATDAVIIVDDNNLLEELLYYMVGMSSLRVYIQSGLGPAAAQSLKNMRPPPSFYVIMASTAAMKGLFRTAKESRLLSHSERWHLVFTDFDHDTFPEGETRVTLQPSLCCLVLSRHFPCQCNLNMDFISEMGETAMMQTGQLLKEVLQSSQTLQTSVNIDCESPNKTVRNNGTRREFLETTQKVVGSFPLLHLQSCSDEIRLSPNVSLYVLSGAVSVGSWTPEGGLVLSDSGVLQPVKRFFRVGVAQAIPWAYRVTDGAGQPIKGPDGAEIWTGYCMDFLARLAADMNFDYEIVPNEKFGARVDGSWNGLIGDLASGRTDLAVAALTMTAEREEVVDFVAPYFEQTGISIVIRKPERRTSLFKFMTVLRLEVWLSIVAALVVTAVMIWFLDKHSPYSARNNKALHPNHCREFTLKESFWFAMTSFTPQGGGETPKALSGRTLVVAYWLFVVLMLATFTANLAAFLTVERMQAPVQSLEQLSRQSRINYTVVADSDTHSYFRNMKHAEESLYRVWKEITLNASSYDTQYRVWDYPIKEQYGHILQAIEKAGPVPDAATGFRMVNEHESGWFALIHDAAEIKYEVTRNCNLTEVGEPFAEQPYAVAVQQGSQLNEEISRMILDLQKERYFESLNSKYWNNSGKGICLNSDDNEGITLESLGGVFIATLFGLALSMITLAVEICLHKRNQKSKVLSDTDMKNVYPEYLSKKEFCTLHLPDKSSKLINPNARIITIFPRNQLY